MRYFLDLNIKMRRYYFIIVIGLAPMILFCCSSYQVTEGGGIDRYNFSQPTVTYQLPKALKEISGITFYDTTQTLACVQDEKGSIYFYSLKDEKIIKKEKFESKGDYEDIAFANDKYYILRSDGDLFRIKYKKDGTQKVKKYETRLKQENDTEGLCYDQENNRLIVLCKEKGGKKLSKDKKKAVYIFSLKKKEVEKEPLFVIERKDVKEMLGEEKVKFKPAAIAIHPITKEFYVIDSVGGILLVLTSSGKIREATRLNAKLFPQPEGITFDSIGNLFISNEGKNGPGTILKFEYIKL